MSYTNSASFAGRNTVIEYNIGSGFVQLAEIKQIQFTGSKFDLEDVTNMQSGNFREWLPTLGDSGELSFSGNYIPGNQTQTDLLNAFNNATLVQWLVILPANRGTISFSAFVQSLDRDLSVDKAATISGKLKITGVISIA